MTRILGSLGGGHGFVTSGLYMNLDPGNSASYSGSGTTVTDLSGTGHNGTIYGSLGYSTSNSGVWNFTNNGAYILAGTLPYSGSSVNSWSMGIWVQPLTANGNIISMSVTNPSGSWNMPPIRASNQTFIGKVWNNNYLTSQVFNIGVWYYVVLTFDYTAGTQNLYVDGNLVASQSGISSQSSGSDNYWFIGQSNPGADNSGNLVGNIGAIHYYGNKALTGAEVVRNYNALQKRYKTTGYVTNGLVMYWDFGNSASYPGTGTTVTDLSGNGNNGTINGSGGSYSSTFGGVYTFGGNGNTITGGPNLSSGNFTVMGSARYLNGQNLRIISALNNNWLLGHWNGSNMNYYSAGWVSAVNQGSTDNAWRIYTGTGNPSAGVYSMYANTSLIVYNSAGTAGPNQFAINSYTNTSEYSNGQFGFLLAYNRVLTQAEIAQNYEYFKGRYSLVKQSYECVQQYGSNQTWVNPGISQADLVVVGGGGGGGSASYGGGGGAGGMIYNTNQALGSSYVITTGAGGGSNAQGSSTSFGSLATATGGGYGGNGAGGSGGSGGGSQGGSTSYSAGAGTTNQGNNGGGGFPGYSYGGGSGGGGNQEVGHNGNGFQGNYFAGSGGLGRYISGIMYSAGGGGYDTGGAQGSGGAGGTQGNGYGTNGSATAGNANTGNGGGGGGASGGSGVVIVRYKS